MRISWVSNAPWARTGYGNQTLLFVPRIQALGHKVAITAFWGLEGGVLNWNGIPVYGRGYHPYGMDVVSAHAASFGADVVVTLIDAWVVEPAMFAPGTRWVAWYPIDHEPLPPPVRDKVSRAWRRFVYSRFGERMTQDAGLDCTYIPHGVDTKAFRPLDRVEARANLNWPMDKFVVGMVAANKGTPSRKAFPSHIEAFAELRRRHSDVMLYLHTVAGAETQGVDLRELLGAVGLRYGFPGRCNPREVDVLICDQYQNLIGYPDDYMAAVYNAMDVHFLASMGEGFGIPILEAQACGTPVIVGDWTAMPELCFSGWKVPREEAERFWTPLGAWQFLPRTGALVDALEAAYKMRGNEDYRRMARDGALAYDADKIAEKYWRPALADMAAAIDKWNMTIAAEPDTVAAAADARVER